MIYPTDYKCLICKKRFYGCPFKNSKFMLSCSKFVPAVLYQKPLLDLALGRCLFGVCPCKIFKPIES